jgi:4-amino-4-deoxychorismate lyase
MQKCFETIKAFDGEVYNLKYHQKRYGGEEDLKNYLTPPKDGLYRCKLIYEVNEILDVSYFKYIKRDIRSLKLVHSNNIEYDKKYLNRDMIDELFLNKEDCDDILIVKNSFITDTSIANIAFLKNGIWYTPKTPLLKGTTRARLLDEDFLKEADIKPEDLKSFESVALLNAMIDFDIIPSLKIKG